MTVKVTTAVVLTLLIMSGAGFAASPAETFQAGNVEEAVKFYHQAIENASSEQVKAQLHKELADLFAGKEDFNRAAPEYVAALGLYRGFPVAERVQMAVRISWGDRLDDAIRELRAVLLDDPTNVGARVHLARTLSWKGAQDDALREVDMALASQPENRDALLVKANALRWKGLYGEAITLYRQVLTGGENFDAEIGLAYALLRSGHKGDAVAISRALKPAYPYQERDLKGLVAEIDTVTTSTVDARYGYYNDTDDNQVNRYGLSYSYRQPSWSIAAEYLHDNARDDYRHVSENSFVLGGHLKATDTVTIGAGGGIHQVDNGSTSALFTWRLNSEVEVGRGVIGFGLRKDLFNDTAQLMENKIRVLSVNAYLSQRLSERFSLYGRYDYRSFSDVNHANDVTVGPTCTVWDKNPIIRAGYRFRYLNFDHQSGDGYFDPENFMAHQVFVSLDWSIDRLGLFLEPYGGFQSFDRYAEHTDNLFGGITGTISYRLTKRIRSEVNGEFGNYALGTATGFKYFQVGTHLAYSF